MSEDIAINGPAVRVWGLGGTEFYIETPTATVSVIGGGSLFVAPTAPTIAFTDEELLCALTAPSPVLLLENWSTCGDMAINAAMPLLYLGDSVGSCEIEVGMPELLVESTQTFGSGAIDTPKVLVAITSTGSGGELHILVVMPTVSLESTNTVGTLEVVVPAPRLSLLGLGGTVAELLINTPVPLLAFGSFESSIGVLDLAVPVPEILLVESYGSWKCLVLNTDTMALSEYSNFDFVGFAKLGSITLALDRNGSVYSLGGSDDAGVDIAAEFETGLDDMKTSKSKRLMRVDFGIKSDGDGTYKSRHWDGYGIEKVVETTDNQYVESKKVKADKMRRSRVLGINYENTNGADFLVDSIELYIKFCTKRRGND